MSDIEIMRGYEVLPDNNVRFGIKVINNTEFIIVDVEVILDYSNSLFNLRSNILQHIPIINPNALRTIEFILKPFGCIHKEEIGATIRYKDHTGKKHTLEMRPKEVHCVCPFLKAKTLTKAEFLELSNKGHSNETGLNFQGVSVKHLTSFLVHTCKSRHYKVDEISIDRGKMLYLASDSIGEIAYYLLTALIKEEKGLTRVMLKTVSNKPHGLNGFLNETVADIRHEVSTVQSAKEIGIINKEQVINIIDSVVQRTSFTGGYGLASVNIDESVVQHTKFANDEEKTQKNEYLGLEQEERKSLHKQKEEETARPKELKRQPEKDKHTIRKVASTKFFALALVVSALLMGYWLIVPDYNNIPDTNNIPENVKPSPTPTPEITATTTLNRIATPTPTESISESAQDKTMTNSIGMEFVLIPTGEFEMGSIGIGNGIDDYEWRPIHNVKIEKGYYLGKYEVTQKQWQEVMGNNPSTFKGDDLPVESVYWNDTQDFIKKLNEIEGTNKYRLPSEAEWEYAVRSSTSIRYSFGDSSSDLVDYAWYEGNSDDKTHPVGQKKPNLWGLYDMHGNVWEWVQDRWHESYDGAPADGSAWESGSSSARVKRGGSWFHFAPDCRSDNREQDNPNYSSLFVGFRLMKKI